MHPQDEPASSSLKKGAIILLSTAGVIFLAESMGFSEFGIGISGLATLIGVTLYFTG
jgi:hypothetical protein